MGSARTLSGELLAFKVWGALFSYLLQRAPHSSTLTGCMEGAKPEQRLARAVRDGSAMRAWLHCRRARGVGWGGVGSVVPLPTYPRRRCPSAVQAHARDELGIDMDQLANPLQVCQALTTCSWLCHAGFQL